MIKSQKRNPKNLLHGFIDIKQGRKPAVFYTAGDRLVLGCAFRAEATGGEVPSTVGDSWLTVVF